MRLLEPFCDRFGLGLATPRRHEERGSQVSLHHAEGYAAMQALIAEGVIGDFRAPDIMRFGFAPLYLRFVDIWDATERLLQIMAEERWRLPRFQQRSRVT